MDASLRHQQRFEFSICSVMLFRIVNMMCWYIKYTWATASDQPGLATLATPYVVIRESLHNVLDSGVGKKQLLSAKFSAIGRDSRQGSTLCSLGRLAFGMEQMAIFGENLGRLFLGMKTWVQDGYRGHRLTYDFFKFCIDILFDCVYIIHVLCVYTHYVAMHRTVHMYVDESTCGRIVILMVQDMMNNIFVHGDSVQTWINCQLRTLDVPWGHTFSRDLHDMIRGWYLQVMITFVCILLLSMLMLIIADANDGHYVFSCPLLVHWRQ